MALLGSRLMKNYPTKKSFKLIVISRLPTLFFKVFHRVSTLSSIIMQGTSLSRQERDCKLYDEFDKFSHVKGETLYRAPHHPQQYPTAYPTNLNHTQPYVPQNAYPPPTIPQQPQAEFPQIDSGLAVSTFLLGDDPTACMNKAMTFLSAVFTPRYPSTNNQLRSFSNHRNQATVQDDRVTVQQVQRRQGEGHMARQCTQPKRRRDAAWFKENVLLVQEQANAFQTDDLDAYDSDCDDISLAKAVLIANLLSYDSDVLSEVPYSDTFQNDMMTQSVQELQYSELSSLVDYPDNEITSDSNIIPYSQYLEETQLAIVQNTNTSAQQNSMILSMFEQMSNHATNWDKANNESKIVNESLTAELERYKERVKILEQRFNVDLNGREKFIDSQMDNMIRMKNTKFDAFETEIDTLK
ncbi:hypothetical protein Tco_1111509 [Tanacetum coccineum]|uniref:Uncharacterized protein n=1 Tax=Tanacetum coccineum TaxID=301880 RepID=A0ABQ5IM91_9ASTR